ncbi:LOW QUALITY PROTEIN: myristoylated alanine-rich C-kinase substrate-like, partial [Solanum pennellii]|uniref:LOW QUALITY PROTEIN: myristoylated alanine-rich C-kinase substrate-like n=1 Tax=Solanum pennellii TaxID=28526 RepID=A0ABM1UVI6_SOLPN
MAPKQDRIYASGRSKSVAPSACMVIGSDDERDPEYVPPGTSTPSRAARAPRATPKKVASGVVTASQSDEERTLTGTPSGSATNEEGASGSLGVSWSEEASGSAEVPAPTSAAASASSDEADSSESTSGSPAQAPTPATNQPNRLCVDGQFQVYSDAKFLTDKGVMTRTLTLERRVLTRSLPTMPEITISSPG